MYVICYLYQVVIHSEIITKKLNVWEFKLNYPKKIIYSVCFNTRRRVVVFITTAKLHSTKPKPRFCAGPNPARGALGIRDGEDL